MIFKILEKKIKNINDATVFNFVSAFSLWIFFLFLNFFILVNGDAKHFFVYLISLLVGILFLFLIIKVIILDFYKKKWLAIIFLVIVPALFCVFFNTFIFLWETTNFVGPNILLRKM